MFSIVDINIGALILSVVFSCMCFSAVGLKELKVSSKKELIVKFLSSCLAFFWALLLVIFVVFIWYLIFS